MSSVNESRSKSSWGHQSCFGLEWWASKIRGFERGPPLLLAFLVKGGRWHFSRKCAKFFNITKCIRKSREHVFYVSFHWCQVRLYTPVDPVETLYSSSKPFLLHLSVWWPSRHVYCGLIRPFLLQPRYSRVQPTIFWKLVIRPVRL